MAIPIAFAIAIAIARDPATFEGPGGSHFDDGTKYLNIVGIRAINIRSGDQVDAIQVDYALADGTIFNAPQCNMVGWVATISISL